MTPDQLDERCQRGAARPNPVGQGRHIQLDASAGVDVTLPIERLMLAEFGIEDHRQHARSGTGAGNDMERRRGLSDFLARSAGEFLPHRLNHLPLTRNDFQCLGDILAELRQPTAAGRAGARSRDNDSFTRQIGR
jgi:hypothetical protein